jgi:hypothetical protein
MIAALTPGRMRKAERTVHLLAALVLLTYVYTPLGEPLEDIVRFAVFPVLAMSGMAMWHAARVRRAFRGLRNSTKAHRAERKVAHEAARNG